MTARSSNKFPPEFRGSVRWNVVAGAFLLLVLTLPLLMLVRGGRSSKAARAQLDQEGISFDQETFFAALKRGDITTTRLFLDAGMGPDSTDENGESALMVAIAAHREPITEALLKAGANVNARTKNRSTALHFVALQGDKQTTELLLKYKADVNVQSDIGETPLMIAALRGFPETVKVLLAAGADVNAKDNRGETPLMHAVERNHTEVIEVLKVAGAKE